MFRAFLVDLASFAYLDWCILILKCIMFVLWFYFPPLTYNNEMNIIFWSNNIARLFVVIFGLRIYVYTFVPIEQPYIPAITIVLYHQTNDTCFHGVPVSARFFSGFSGFLSQQNKTQAVNYAYE